MASSIAYDPDDPLQSSFLAALEKGEVGSSSYAYTEGVGGSNLAGYATSSNGFPIWNGQGSSHAAGAFQFQPGTWSTIASQYNLNFQNPQDQNAGAWYLAQETYAQNNNGASLEDALQNGQYSSIQTALAKVWPSVTGNASAPSGLVGSLSATSTGADGTTAASSGTGTSTNYTSGVNTGSTATTAANNSGSGGIGSGIVSAVTGYVGGSFARLALIIVGCIVILVALWQLLSNQGVVPSPAQSAKALAL